MQLQLQLHQQIKLNLMCTYDRNECIEKKEKHTSEVDTAGNGNGDDLRLGCEYDFECKDHALHYREWRGGVEREQNKHNMRR